MPTKCFNISGATLQDLFTLRAELPTLYNSLMEERKTDQELSVPVAIEIPGRFPWLVPMDLEQETYGQSIDAGQSIELMQNDELAGRLRLLAIYFQPTNDRGNYDSDKVSDTELLLRWLPADVALTVSDYFLNELTRIQAAVSSQLKEVPYSKEELKAGVKDLEKFGAFATLHNLAKSNNKSVAWWCKQPWVYVNEYLLLENHKAHVQQKLQKLLNPQTAWG